MLCSALALAALAAPATALDATRQDVRAFAAEMKRKHGLDAAWLDTVLADATSQPRIIELMSKPAEKTMPWHQYRKHFLTEERIAAGVDFWVAHRERLAAIERKTGVAQHAIVGILGAETFFGRITGRFRVLDALATLAFDYPPRAGFFRSELEHFLLLAQENSIDTATVLGSYAGAMGRAQFMPSSYRAYAVDGDGDDRRDLWGSWDDVIASIANYLAKHGWRAGEPVAAPALLWFPHANGLVPGPIAPDTTVKALRDRGLRFETSLALRYLEVMLVLEMRDDLLFDRLVALVTDGRNLVGLYSDREVPLRVNVNLLTPFFVFKSQLVEPFAALRRGALQGRPRFVRRQFVGRSVRTIVNAARDHRPVRIAFEKLHEHFVANAGNKERAPLLARGALSDANPARAVLIALALTVPEEMYFHPAMFVRVNLLSFGTDDHG
jgi:membrane-bound lytic murein transglycosylase B